MYLPLALLSHLYYSFRASTPEPFADPQLSRHFSSTPRSYTCGGQGKRHLDYRQLENSYWSQLAKMTRLYKLLTKKVLKSTVQLDDKYYTLYIVVVHCTLYIVHCTLYIVRCTINDDMQIVTVPTDISLASVSSCVISFKNHSNECWSRLIQKKSTFFILKAPSFSGGTQR